MAPWQCSFRPQNLIATAVLNTTTDAALLVIPVILLYQLKVSIKKKLVIGLILSSGVFVIIAAIIRAQLSLGNAPTAANINSWGVRETVIVTLPANSSVTEPRRIAGSKQGPAARALVCLSGFLQFASFSLSNLAPDLAPDAGRSKLAW
ncbi:hypothetical protein KVT40_005594 [Elsinoe batatas]|uniref:Rhodopsin domain-containing protein n=1 Tax=Elsinoe batatas TaxID=2601811 RepID=A0A8K0L1F8_9PEZI|nr:hypothetical protein KVT40_005594 [Elsinoe batatas]